MKRSIKYVIPMLTSKTTHLCLVLVSDSKKDLEREMDGNREEVEKSKGSKRPLQESNTDNADSVPLVKKRKELKESVKTQKAAAIATANEMAKQIFQERNINSSETEKQKHLQEIKQLTDKVKELNEKLEDSHL